MNHPHDITRILREIASGTKTSVGDHWSTEWCNDAADYIDELRANLYVVHMDTDILKVGSESECHAHKDAQKFNTSCWQIHPLSEFGSVCYDEGWDSAAAQGATQGPEY